MFAFRLIAVPASNKCQKNTFQKLTGGCAEHMGGGVISTFPEVFLVPLLADALVYPNRS